MVDRIYIAIDGGGSGTRIGVYDEAGTLLAESMGEHTNPHQVTPAIAADRLATVAKTVAQDWPKVPVVVFAGVSGARDEASRKVIADTLWARVPGAERVVVLTDIHAHLLANAGQSQAILVIAGTGSSVAVLDASQNVHTFGGRGPILGDDGSAYHVATTTLRRSFQYKDRRNETCTLLTALARAAGLGDVESLVGWCATAQKQDIARLAETVLHCGGNGDPLATQCLVDCAQSLGGILKDAVTRTRLNAATPVFLMGGLFEHSAYYSDLFQGALRALGIENKVGIAPYIGHSALFAISRQSQIPSSVPFAEVTVNTAHSEVTKETTLDCMSTAGLVERMQHADREAVLAAQECSHELCQIIDRTAHAFRNGGRLIYVGAGTSGRIGVLDASECPPTFGVPPGRVIGIIAGGDRALRESIEGAEDDTALGKANIDAIDPPVGEKDVVVGIAASGTTPYTLAALEAAKIRNAATALVSCVPNVGIAADFRLVMPTGPEVLPGSTRLKAGTATKLVLNAITTGAMALSGRVFEGYMIGVQPTNQKLRKRAAYIISVLTGIHEAEAAQRLVDAGNNVAVAVLMERLKISAQDARALYERAHGDVRAAIALHASGETA
ncbi:MAG TPA: N-acetylmuramic acid 6-phosphate etherase [Candidatus Hydrogenedentes bacterium]|nr:N-acetylmuramic acid 6-phosphate etherase [Candidatus Hydrogenedentota bacterium]